MIPKPLDREAPRAAMSDPLHRLNPPASHDTVFANYLAAFDAALAEINRQRNALFGATVGHIRAADAEVMRCRTERIRAVADLGARS